MRLTKKIIAYACAFTMVVASMTGYQAKADDGTWSIGEVTWSALSGADTRMVCDVPFTAYQNANPDNYLYCVYLDEVSEEGRAINGSAGWDWLTNITEYTADGSGFNNNYKFDGILTTKGTAADVTYFEPGSTHTIYIAAYETKDDAVNTENQLDIVSKEVTVPGGVELTEEQKLVASLTSDDNMAKGKTAFASEGFGDVSSLVDGNAGTGVQSGYKDATKIENDYFGVDLGSVQTIGSVVVSWETSHPSEYEVYVAGEDEVYTKVATQTTDVAANEVLKTRFAAVEARYVKIVETVANGYSTTYGMYPYEIGVFAPVAGEEVPTTEEVTTEEVTTEEVTTEEATTEEVTTEEATTEEVTTEEVTTEEVTTEEVTTEEATPAEMTFEQCVVNVGDDQTRHEAGNYKYYVGEWNGSTAQIAVDPANPDHIKAQQLSSLWYDAWGFQIEITKSGFEPGKKYGIQVDMEASVADGTYKTNASDEVIDIVAGVNRLERTVEADENGNVNITVGLGWVGTAVVLDFSNVVVAEVLEIETVTDAETTEAATTEAATTEAATTAAATTTEAATTVAATTVATTTTAAVTTTATADKAVKAPGKAKVKKVTAKKKASKTVKLTLKKVKGAKGYQVQISKAKKFTKKNILVKKIVKKVKPAIKSKKLKGQKKLFVRARAYVLDANGKKVYGKWSVAKKVKIK